MDSASVIKISFTFEKIVKFYEELKQTEQKRQQSPLPRSVGHFRDQRISWGEGSRWERINWREGSRR
jgi:hypothetical protein